ncbi:hypothetical protein JVT61DRAFT_15094 [Boletus reticuloceps]|uniref:Uncharacterized protein n=1 Tax=Boletus reticuloceps TaxID=495285 RepID=A0A8I2YS69_9AGAM|nr:hypothetical protein JVT61DRAFT_15094 [Boletus reticuloceps]
MADPILEIHPDFASNAYRIVREALMANFQEDVDQAIEHITSAWDAEHQLRIKAWNLEREAEVAEVERARAEQRQREEDQRRLDEAEAEKERKEAEKKKPKINDFDKSLPPPGIVAPRPSQYALHKISSFEYVELWYFSLEGCTEASRNNKSQADDAFGLSSSHNVLTLRPVASVKASRFACADHDLSFSDFQQAKNVFLEHIKCAPWPDKHVDALAEFFWNLENHPIRTTKNGNLIALHYASRIHRRWHDDLKSNTGSAFNIALISEVLMNRIAFEISTSLQANATRKVSPFPSPTFPRTDDIPLPLHMLTRPHASHPQPPPCSLLVVHHHPLWSLTTIPLQHI